MFWATRGGEGLGYMWWKSAQKGFTHMFTSFCLSSLLLFINYMLHEAKDTFNNSSLFRALCHCYGLGTWIMLNVEGQGDYQLQGP